MDNVIARAISDAIDNLITLVKIKIRLQICGGLPDELGIDKAQWSALVDGQEVASGTTSANGEIELVMLPHEPLVLRVFDTDYPIALVDSFPDVTTTAGVQKRFDTLGYMTGYLLDPRADAAPDDNKDGVMTRQAILNFQTDNALAIDSEIGKQTQGKLTQNAGA